jgi:AcrR family transcriptional regulator
MPHQEALPTREALIEAGLTLFGRHGFDATSTRRIAALAGANIGSISYHFGSKEGLRLACAEHVAGRISAMARAALGNDECGTAAEAERQVVALVEGFVQLISRPEARHFVAFLLREFMQPGEVLERILDRVIGPIHGRASHLLALASGKKTESDEIRIAVFALVGQIVYFRIAEPIVLKRMGWTELGPAEARSITTVLVANLEAAIQAARKG